MTPPKPSRRRLVAAAASLLAIILVFAPLGPFRRTPAGGSSDGTKAAAGAGGDDRAARRRRLREEEAEEGGGGGRWFADVPRLLSLATRPPPDPSPPSRDGARFRVLLIATSLSEYDKGTRGTSKGYDRLKHVTLPPLTDAVRSMTSRGWEVDVYLVLGYPTLAPERRTMIEEALPPEAGLEVWEDAIPYHYAKTYGKSPREDQAVEPGMHALSRQHRFVLRDKLPFYDFFVCFEDDMRITADHVVNFLRLSADIKNLHDRALASPDGRAHVADASPPRSERHAPNDGASVGNDVVDDPIGAEHVQRLFPGLLRVEVLDRAPGHPLRRPGVLDRHRFAEEVPPSPDAYDADGSSILDPAACCDEPDPPRGKATPRPAMDEVVMWETNVQAAGVRNFPAPLGWAASLPVEDRSDVGSFWSGYPSTYGAGKDAEKRPRRVDATLGQQAGFMATRDQIVHFHERACPGGFLPPFDGDHWRGDSLQRHSVEFWSGGFQLFGQCFLNRILSLDPRKFERQLIYHVSNNKQRTVPAKKVIRVGDFYGQLIKVKERAEKFARRSS